MDSSTFVEKCPQTGKIREVGRVEESSLGDCTVAGSRFEPVVLTLASQPEPPLFAGAQVKVLMSPAQTLAQKRTCSPALDWALVLKLERADLPEKLELEQPPKLEHSQGLEQPTAQLEQALAQKLDQAVAQELELYRALAQELEQAYSLTELDRAVAQERVYLLTELEQEVAQDLEQACLPTELCSLELELELGLAQELVLVVVQELEMVQLEMGTGLVQVQALVQGRVLEVIQTVLDRALV